MIPGPLFNDDAETSMVSPLVDVVMNLMITFFVFLMIYMAVVIPEEKDHERVIIEGVIALPDDQNP